MIKNKNVKIGSEPTLEVQKKFIRNMVIVSAILLLIALLAVSIEGYSRLVSREKVEESAELIRDLPLDIKEDVLEKLAGKRAFSIKQVDNHFIELLNFKSAVATESSTVATDSGKVEL
jgi:transposase